VSLKLSRPVTFVTASAALVVVFASSGAPIPLYNLYRTVDGVANAQLAITTVVYLAVTALSLLVLGRLSDHLGRKPVAIAALLSSAIGCLLLTQVHALPLLLAGRAFQGIACGLAASSLGSYVVDTAPTAPRWLAPLVTSNAPTFGIPLGALVSGALVETAPAPRTLGYEIIAGVLVALAITLLFGPETVRRTRGAVSALRPRVQLSTGPGRARLMTVVAATFLATWSYNGFYQAFAPSLTADHLGTSNSIVIALVFSSIVVLSPLGGTLTGRLRPVVAIRVGLIGFLVTVAVALAALYAGSIGLFLGASLVAGMTQGAATTGAMRALLTGADPLVRAGLLSSVYLISYAGAAGPALAASAFATTVDLTVIATGYACLVLIAVTVAVIGSRRFPWGPVAESDAASEENS
jgi:MFS family permease